jgi:ribonucleoside-diphosphate reductase alpha chain
MSNKHEALSLERKQLQDEGRIPQWYSTPAWQMFKSKYLVESEKDVKTRFQVIAKTLAKHLPVEYRDEYESKFYHLMWEGILSPASPVLANTGTDRGTPVSCSGQYIGDSVDSFYSNLRETALLSKNSFGTSGYFGDIRPRGSKIAGGGVANGAKPVIEDFFQCAANISHGGMRVGSFAAFVNMADPVFDECVSSLHLDHKGKNYGWIIDDKFTDELRKGEPTALAKWQKALHAKLLSGKGYFFFPDKANRHRPQMYKDLGLDIKATNLCTEIMLHSSEEYTYSCILSSLNLLHWDRIKASTAVFDSMVFLDCLCSEFIKVAEHNPGLEKVLEFTRKGRAVGLGVIRVS